VLEWWSVGRIQCSITPPLHSKTIMTETIPHVVKIGIIGAGNRGINAFGKIFTAREDAEVVALADPNPARMEGAEEMLGHQLRKYTSAPEMIQQEELDGVVITVPDYLHAEMVLTTLDNGVAHVLVDKPLATTTADCLRVADALSQYSGKVAMGFNLRHIPIIAKVKEIIDSGEIGELMLMENREYYDLGRTYMARWNRKYALSGGLWVHKGSHDFDIFNWWNSKGTPVRVSASSGINALRADKLPFVLEDGKPAGPNCTSCYYKDICPDFNPPVGSPQLFNSETASVDGYIQDLCIFLSDKDTHDNGISLVEYDNNVRVSHSECFVCNFTDRMYTVAGDRGTLMFSLENPTKIEFRPRWGETFIIDVPLPEEGSHGGADPILAANFIASIKGEAKISSTVRDGIRAVAVGEAAELSSRQGRMVNISELVDLSNPAYNV